MTVTEYIQKAYTIKDKQRELEIIKMDRDNRIRKVVKQYLDEMYNHEEGLIEHLKHSSADKDA